MFNPRQLIILTTVALTIAQPLPGPHFNWDCTNTRGTCNNACFASNCLGLPNELTYDSVRPNAYGRRRDSGCGRTPCSKQKYKYMDFGNSCDEYPFASTFEGGAGAILRCVDSTENESEGGQLSAFYRNVPHGHRFTLWLSNYGLAPFCADAENCINDGGEFKLHNRQLVYARRANENRSFASADSNSSNVGTPFRKFMGSDGIERLWLSRNTTGTPVGEYVWDGVGEKVLITSEIIS